MNRLGWQRAAALLAGVTMLATGLAGTAGATAPAATGAAPDLAAMVADARSDARAMAGTDGSSYVQAGYFAPLRGTQSVSGVVETPMINCARGEKTIAELALTGPHYTSFAGGVYALCNGSTAQYLAFIGGNYDQVVDVRSGDRLAVTLKTLASGKQTGTLKNLRNGRVISTTEAGVIVDTAELTNWRLTSGAYWAPLPRGTRTFEDGRVSGKVLARAQAVRTDLYAVESGAMLMTTSAISHRADFTVRTL